MLGWDGLISEQSKETHAEHARRRGLSKQVGVKAPALPYLARSTTSTRWGAA